MELFEYIKSQLPQMPNVQIMKDMGANDELVEYIKESPENTNLNVMGSITSDGGGDAEVWLVGDTGVEAQGMMMFELSNVDATDHLAELLTNGANYKVFLNGTELPYLEGDENEASWSDSNDYSTATMGIGIENDSGTLYGTAMYYQASTAPTSVEVSVKAK